MRKLLIAGNWKMNCAPNGAYDANSPYHPRADVDVVLFPTYLDLPAALEAKLICGPQCAHPEDHGAHTGDVSMAMVSELGAEYVLCGHSERRAGHGETNEDVAMQTVAALEKTLHPIVCVGETATDRDAGNAQHVVQKQIAVLPLESDLTIAYEPVWAIGTGKTATPEQAQEMHAFIRSLLPEDKRNTTRILYGGSMKPTNAKDLLEQPDIDGGLIGGASLQPDQFAAIIEIARSLST